MEIDRALIERAFFVRSKSGDRVQNDAKDAQNDHAGIVDWFGVNNALDGASDDKHRANGQNCSGDNAT